MRNYRREYDTFHRKPEQVRRRAQRNKSRRDAIRAGLVKKGDTLDLHHVNNNVFDQRKSNLKVLSMHKNRSIK